MATTLADVLSQRWLIHRTEVLNYLPLFVSFLNGNKLDIESVTGDGGKCEAHSRNASGDFYVTGDLTNDKIPDNSIAVIPIQGVIYAERSRDLMISINDAENNDKFIAILFMVNTPGGMVFMTDIAADAIKNCSLPTVAYIMNMAASAGMWLTSAMDKRFASSKIDRIGSIGVKTSVMDFNSFLKDKLGVSIWDIYATKSTKKDNEFRQLLEENAQPLIDDLDYVNEIFHQAIIDNLGIAKDSEVFTGEIYNAVRAQELGLIDGICDINTVLETTYKLGIDTQIRSINNHFNSKSR